MLALSTICCVFFKQKTAYEMRISDWSSDVCSSDLLQQIVSSVSLQQSGLLVIAVAVNHAVRMTERAAGVHGIDRGVDARILARRHAGLQAVRHVRQRLDRKSVVEGTRVAVRVDLGGRRLIKHKSTNKHL